MGETVSIRKDLAVIQVDSYGEVSSDDLAATLQQILAIRRDHGLCNVFVDQSRATAFPSTLPAFQFGTELAQRASRLRIAIAASPITHENLKFLETVAINRGTQLQVFGSAREALNWLTAPTGPAANGHNIRS